MKENIHELRTRIDGLAQLIKSICDMPLYLIPESIIPQNMTMEDMVQSIKDSGKILYSDKIQSPPIQKIGPNFLFESYKSLLLAKAWLGNVLADLGEETPYKNDGNRKTVEDIEPTADSSAISTLENMNHIEKIDWLRQEIQKIKSSTVQYTNMNGWIGFFSSKAFECLTEARFHLGVELQSLKEQSK